MDDRNLLPLDVQQVLSAKNDLATMYSLQRALGLLSHRSWIAVAAISTISIAALCLRTFGNEAALAGRATRKKDMELRSLAGTILTYGRSVHERFPTGAVVVSESDLAAQLRRSPDSVVTALDLLLMEQKVQRAQLSGYWRLHG